jgi:hypothetical protein
VRSPTAVVRASERLPGALDWLIDLPRSVDRSNARRLA